MDEDVQYVYSMPEKQKKKPRPYKALALLIVVAVIIVAVYLYLTSFSVPESSEKFLETMDGMIAELDGKTAFPQQQVSQALENPSAYSSGELINYTQESAVYAMQNSLIALRDMYESRFSKGYDNAAYLSATAYMMILVSTSAMAYTAESSLTDTCTGISDEDYSKTCVINLLDAQKLSLDTIYAMSNAEDTSKCASLLGSDEEIDLSYADPFAACREMLNYRDQMLQYVRDSNLDYNQKYFMPSSIYMQNRYFGGNVSATGTNDIVMHNIA